MALLSFYHWGGLSSHSGPSKKLHVNQNFPLVHIRISSSGKTQKQPVMCEFNPSLSYNTFGICVPLASLCTHKMESHVTINCLTCDQAKHANFNMKVSSDSFPNFETKQVKLNVTKLKQKTRLRNKRLTFSLKLSSIRRCE